MRERQAAVPEPLNKPVETKVEVKHPLREFIRLKMPPIAYAISSIWHLGVAACLRFGSFSKSQKDSLKETAAAFTKIINSLVYTDLAVEAWKNKASFDFLGRIAEPVFSIFSDLSHYHLFRGFSSALNQLHMVNFPRLEPSKSLWQNFLDNMQACYQVFRETWPDGAVGPDRKLFKGRKDEGHTLAFASHLQLVFSGLALLNGNRRNVLDKVFGTLRNVSGVLADIGLLWTKDVAARRTGMWYLFHVIGDTAKRFVSKESSDIIDNLIMPFYNAALYNFGLTTRRQSDKEYQSEDSPTKVHVKVDDEKPASNKASVLMAV